MKIYEVSARKSDGWWVLQAVEAPGAISQVRKLADADVIREAIAWIEQVPVGEVSIHLTPRVDAAVDPLLAQYREVGERARALERERAVLQRALARGLTSHGVSYRDAGELLDLSHQRIGQLVRS